MTPTNNNAPTTSSLHEGGQPSGLPEGRGVLRTWPTRTLVNILDPDPADIHIQDIAHHLAGEPRFGNGTPFPYSVAQHSIYVFRQVPARLGNEVALQALMHDAPEYLLKDIPKPVKLLLPEYEKLEALLWAAVCEKFGMETELHPAVKRADQALLDFEKQAWKRPAQRLIPRVHSEMAGNCFLDCYYRLTDPGYDKSRAPLHVIYM